MRHVQRVTSPDRLDWKVKRLVVPHGMRPMSRMDLLDAATPRRTSIDGVSGSVPDAMGGVTGPLPLGAVLSLLLMPFLPLVLALRYVRVLRWTVEARTYPWGRRYPPVVLSYAIRGHNEALHAVDELANALKRGDGSPALAGAEFLPQSRITHDGTSDRTTFDTRQARVYRQGRR
jgi:hypothetical protein